MKINKAYKFRLYPDEEQAKELKQIAGNNRFVWNEFVAFNNAHKELNGNYIYRYDLQSYLLHLKEENDFLKKSFSQSLQYQAKFLDQTLHRAYEPDVVKQRNKAIAKAMAEPDEEKRKRKLAKAYNHGFPNFHKKRDYNDTIGYPQFFEVKKSRIKLPKIGWIKYTRHRNIEGKIKNLTVSQNGNQWYVSICSDVEIEEQEIKTDNVIGIDLGLKNFAAFNGHPHIKNQKLYRKKEKKIKRLQRSLSRRLYDSETKKSSNRRTRQQLKVHKVHQKIRNQRQDFLHKLTHNMIANYDGFILEDLAVRNMMKNHCLAKSIQDASWSEFARILEYKSKWNFKYFEKIDRFAPSSQICSKCGHRQAMPLEKRTFNCEACGFAVDRDDNASVNIYNLSKLAATKNLAAIKNTVVTTEIYGQGETAVADSANCQKELSLAA